MKLPNVVEHRDKSLIYKPNSSSITKKEDSWYFHKVTRNGVSVSSSREWEAAIGLWQRGVAVESEALVTVMTVVI